jgi:hypothetical protein
MLSSVWQFELNNASYSSPKAFEAILQCSIIRRMPGLVCIRHVRRSTHPLSQLSLVHLEMQLEPLNDRLASRVEHPGGFGTCVPGAWREHLCRPGNRSRGDPHGVSHSIPTRRKQRPRTRVSPSRPRSPSRAAPGPRLGSTVSTHPGSPDGEGAAQPAQRDTTPSPPPNSLTLAREPTTPEAPNPPRMHRARDRTPA